MFGRKVNTNTPLTPRASKPITEPKEPEPALQPKEEVAELVRLPEFQLIRSSVIASMNVTLAASKTREQVQADVERVVAELITRERM